MAELPDWKMGNLGRARTFYVYELDQSVAIALLKEKLRLSPNETIEAVAQANIHSLTGLGMKPGDVLQHG